MRESKFRGFNRKNGIWLYGFYLQNRGAHFVCPDEFAEGKSWDDYEIDPKTRGEYTGQKDKNGQEIYEGDIVKWENGYMPPNVGVVTYWENDCQFACVMDYGAFDLVKKYAAGGHLSEYKHNTFIVIGNIHDRSATQGDACQSKNPELLEQ